MGNILDSPETGKVVENHSGNGLVCGVASMQGWRREMEVRAGAGHRMLRLPAISRSSPLEGLELRCIYVKCGIEWAESRRGQRLAC